MQSAFGYCETCPAGRFKVVNSSTVECGVETLLTATWTLSVSPSDAASDDVAAAVLSRADRFESAIGGAFGRYVERNEETFGTNATVEVEFHLERAVLVSSNSVGVIFSAKFVQNNDAERSQVLFEGSGESLELKSEASHLNCVLTS